jgi:hypothetical protein
VSTSINQETTLAALHEDVTALKRDLAGLLTHLRSGATNSARTTVEGVEAEVVRMYGKAEEAGCKSAKAIARRIEEQPILSLLVVLGLGYIGGRMLRR